MLSSFLYVTSLMSYNLPNVAVAFDIRKWAKLVRAVIHRTRIMLGLDSGSTASDRMVGCNGRQCVLILAHPETRGMPWTVCRAGNRTSSVIQ
ncbi:hypothetical protein SeMB42_g00311 [Synchytrium endobioticum]|uniref:Uncharacterized protein n=1 Tax=Synchytrium endobioticum TaxID=286115 RepID=A0A507DSC0_9FUNG|nr:hypothetical protein SeMB42_g00311 [Synchytrium endobioticum]